jgi:hypothetical protein
LEKLAKYLEIDCPPVVSRSLHALKALIMKNKANQNKLMESGTIAKILNLCQSKNSEVRDNSASFLAQCLGNEKIKKMLITKGYSIIIEAINLNPNPDALAILHSLLENEDIKASLTKDKKTIAQIVSFLDLLEEKILINDCSVISSLSLGNKKGQKAVINEGAAIKLAKLLGGKSSLTVKYHVAYTVWALAKNSRTCQVALGKANLLVCLITILNDEKSTDILREYTIGAIYALVKDNARNKKEIVNLKGIKSILPLLNGVNQKFL